MIKIYGSPRTSAGRCYLTLEELNLQYEVAPLDMREKKEHKSDKFLKLNPNGKVPCLVDGNFVIWESMAINFYLADKYRPELLGKTPEERGQTMQWSIWALNEIQPPLVDLLIQQLFTPENKRDSKISEKAREKLNPLLAILDHHLDNKHFIANDTFSVADINTFSVINMTTSLSVSLDNFSNITKWTTALKTRPAFKRYESLRG